MDDCDGMGPPALEDGAHPPGGRLDDATGGGAPGGRPGAHAEASSTLSSMVSSNWLNDTSAERLAPIPAGTKG